MFHVLLFEPEIPSNAGNIIRLCANSGAALHLIGPLGFTLEDKKLRRAGLDYHDLAAVTVHVDLQACIGSIPGARVFAVETSATRRYDEPAYRPGDAFLFGPESRGLSAQVIARARAHDALAIPMRSRNRSINLSNAVALVIFEAWRQQGFTHADM